MQRLQSGSCSTQRELQVGEQHEYFKGETQPRVVRHGPGGGVGQAGTCVLPLRGQCVSTSSVMNDSHRVFVKVEVDGIFLVLSQQNNWFPCRPLFSTSVNNSPLTRVKY